MKGNFLKCSFTAGSGLRFFCFVKNKNSEITHWSFCKLLEINCNLLNYTGKYDYKNEYEDEYGLKKR